MSVYETSDFMEYCFLNRRHVPLVKSENGIFFYKKTYTLFLELFNYYYQLDQRQEYDQLVSIIDGLPVL